MTDSTHTSFVVDRANIRLVIDALYAYKHGGQGEPDNRTDDVHELAIGLDDSVTSLNEEAIERMIWLILDDHYTMGEIHFHPAGHREYLATFAAAFRYAIDQHAYSSPDHRAWLGTMKIKAVELLKL